MSSKLFEEGSESENGTRGGRRKGDFVKWYVDLGGLKNPFVRWEN